ncbi:TPA: TrmB family transcriptional regulator [Candidatus Woesearchaeota archaeon]|nr:hypothetical protein [uncultured archaeon]MBS3173008.1 helix-turn-helix domain-containing protein [Candidatus Woesearchaeota archaeon]AQS32916.1 hypothetical protein [uncultured archaeon]AQS34603.1 hypothetical protein [uncultured archaeon]HIH31902.1 TrmB family transcriptional regulator [Candidatus Woesearchaeota archaeon]
MDLIEKLKIAGFTGNEAKIYLELLKRGSISANDLAKKLSMDRTLCYQLLNNLIAKGYAGYIVKENKKYFAATNPDSILISFKEKEHLISNIIPELKSIQKLQENIQEAEIYEGKKGLKVLYENMLKSREIMVFGATGKSYDVLKYELGHIIKESQMLKIKGRMIVDSKLKKHPMTKLKNVKIKFVDKVDAESTTTIFDDKVAIHTLTDTPLIIFIKNKSIAQTYKNYFEYMWKK